MKNPLLLLLLLASTIITQAEDKPLTRYQLLAATVTTVSSTPVGNAESFQRPTIFRIDTQTGETCVYISILETNKLREEWHRISEPPVNFATNQLARAEAVIHWCEQHPDGGQMTGIVLDAVAIKRTQHNAELDRDRILSESKRVEK